MSAVVDIVLAEHQQVLTVPVAAIIEGSGGLFCWVQTAEGVRKRLVRVGDTNDQFSIILDGLNESDEVILNPLAYIDEAQELAMELEQQSSKGSSKNQDSKTAPKDNPAP
jgi:multidrug efflux pump subunit AcrA (membrane-fusion protein)